MKYNKLSLMKLENPNFPINESIIFDPNLIANTKGLNDLKDVKVTGEATYHSSNELLHFDLKIKGVMNVNCAYTLEPVDYPFETDLVLEFAFMDGETLDEDIIVCKGNNIDITPYVYEEIVCSIPLKVVKKDATLPKKGKGWELKDDHEDVKEEQIDPRLAKLKELFK